MRSAFLNQGEICLCTSRILVQEDIYEPFCEVFSEATKHLHVGDPKVDKTFMGPLISQQHFEKVSGLVEQARAAFFLEPKALALDVDGARMVEQTIEDRGGQHLVPEDLAPVDEALVGGDDRRAAGVAAVADLEAPVGVRAEGAVPETLRTCPGTGRRVSGENSSETSGYKPEAPARGSSAHPSLALRACILSCRFQAFSARGGLRRLSMPSGLPQ